MNEFQRYELALVTPVTRFLDAAMPAMHTRDKLRCDFNCTQRRDLYGAFVLLATHSHMNRRTATPPRKPITQYYNYPVSK